MSSPSHAGEHAPRTYPPRPAAVYFYATCLVDLFVPEAGMDAITLLEREGIRVIFPESQSCCGQPAYSSGFPEEARKVAASQLDLFPGDYPIIVPSGSCAGMIRWHWEKIFADDPALHARAAAVAARTYELAEFLLHVVGFQRRDEGEPVTVTLHTSCSARREMGTHLVGRELLARLGNVTLAHHGHESECCGFGGSFSMKHPDISTAMVSDKVAALKATGAREVVTADCGCLLNITKRAEKEDLDAGRSKPSLPGEHLATFLLRRTGGQPARRS
ncbi:(Fe-S)-binding protein [Thauera sp. 2A1]|uniref:(Fe-S)-binding protein n=1 Tax=Thauera sp. 2A1 TaxID=2570191 RepID=UPI001290BE71|nr:(Fe-S)-binding protein [Thauera sp. 2A1]KAI5912619.1 (Fe-S)-binding protein [Thauera sp. 2A1]